MPRSASHAASNSERKVASEACAAAATAVCSQAEAQGGGDQEHRGRGDEERRPHPECASKHEKDDRADAHLKGDRSHRQRPKARRHGVGHERLEGRPLHVDAGVKQYDRRDHAGDTELSRRREQRHPNRREQQATDDERQATAPRGSRPVRRRPRPRHKQKQEHVVDRHHAADRRPVVAERALHERRDEGAEEWPSHTGEESAEPDAKAGGERYAQGRVLALVDHPAIMAFGRTFRISTAKTAVRSGRCRALLP